MKFDSMPHRCDGMDMDAMQSAMPGSMHSSMYEAMPGAMLGMMPGAECCGGRLCPIYECPEERVCHRYICYEVPHIKPCNTKIINHHVYRHTFTPTFSACEENVVENVFDRKCC